MGAVGARAEHEGFQESCGQEDALEVPAACETSLEFGSRERSGVFWRSKDDDDLQEDGENLQGDVVVLDKDDMEILEREQHVLMPKRQCNPREDLEHFGITAQCLGCVSMLRGNARRAHTESCMRRIHKGVGGTVNARRTSA